MGLYVELSRDAPHLINQVCGVSIGWLNSLQQRLFRHGTLWSSPSTCERQRRFRSYGGQGSTVRTGAAAGKAEQVAPELFEAAVAQGVAP